MGKRIVTPKKLVGGKGRGNRKRATDFDPSKYVQKTAEGHKMFSGNLSKPQKIFHKTIQDYIKKQHKFENELYGPLTPQRKMELEKDLHLSLGEYTFHNNSSVSTDSTLLTCMNYGQADFGAYKDLHGILHENLEKAGYYMENVDGSTFEFVKD